ncbi:MAG TPA: MupA/Atu3671 family FMN-dependent luciferase-like monooxygenase, partial [Polyangiaceae bacterium]|nr:MupA/Atu3671 family FMN-dependent luciferase-like monooxygenase [Polyangiaceae bacterium]
FDFYARPPRAMVLDLREPAVLLERLVRALDHGVYPNPVGSAKLMTAAGPLIVSRLSMLESRSGAAVGTVLSASDESMTVSGATHDLELSGLRTLSGDAADAVTLRRHGVSEGTQLPVLDEQAATWLTESNAKAARSEGYFVRRMLARRPLSFPFAAPPAPAAPERVELLVPQATGVPGKRLPALVLAFAARFCGTASFDVAYADGSIRQKSALVPGIFATEVPLGLSLDLASSLGDTEKLIDTARLKLAERWPYATDLFVRQPALPRDPLPVEVLVDVPATATLPPGQLTVVVDTHQARLTLVGRSDRVSPAELANLALRLGMFLDGSADESQPLGRISLVSGEEQQRILHEWNATECEVSPNGCLHTLFEMQKERTPDKLAVTAGGRSLSFRELDRRANALAHELVKLGVGPDTLVGLCLGRSIDLPVAVLAIHKAGGAYVPLDPAYPRERLRFMVADAALKFVVTERAQQGVLPEGYYARVLIDSGVCDAGVDTPPHTPVGLENLAYVIYTSGSTGTPKGVMVEHRNVANFFVGMDQVLRVESPGTWLAVTSLSFDISVLELSWTLTRGFHVVMHAGETPERAAPVRRLDFSAFYFSSDDSGGGPEHYRLLFEGARFADQHGFVAVWTPERHFHAFGGLYPNPSVISAALAVQTQRVALRAGSCVSPLHSPIRIAEEWSLVDNLSNGRVGISFASGWQPNDFAIRPDAFRDRKEQMFADIDVVRRLWRGERVQFKGGTGKDVGVSTLPRPVQKELPVWVTAAGNPETFEAAGRVGANLLTHLLGQTFEEVAEKVRVYRAAWEKAGHAGRGVVTIMLHTFVGSDADEVKETVRGPMKEYLRSAVGLVKQAAWSFPTFKQKFEGDDFAPEKLTPE